MTDIVNHVPFGSDNALSAREIWRRVDMWAESTLQNQLNRLAESGAIKRRQQTTLAPAFRWIYWREGAAS